MNNIIIKKTDDWILARYPGGQEELSYEFISLRFFCYELEGGVRGGIIRYIILNQGNAILYLANSNKAILYLR